MKKRLSLILVLSMLFMLAVGATAAQASPRKMNRFYGQNRFQTSISVAGQLNQSQRVKNVVLASAYSFPDALASGTLAVQLKAPIILLGSGLNDSLESLTYVKNNLAANGTVTIVGGSGVIPPAVEQWLRNNGFKVIRLGGSDRYATDTDIVKQLNVPQGTPIVLANGDEFPDSLGISSLAASKGWPILLTGPNKIPQATLAEIQSDAPTAVYVVGGQGVISSNVISQLQTAAPNAQIQRFGGADRFETLSLILTKFYPSPSQIYLADGYDFADALSGSTLAATNNAPILLLDPHAKDLPSSIHDYLITLRNNGINPQVNVLGGPGAVPDSLVQLVTDLLQSGSTNTVIPPVTPPAGSSSETLTTSNPSVNGFTLSLSPALNGLTAGNFSLVDTTGYPIAITSATTYNGGTTYAINATLTAGHTYLVTATASGYTFGPAPSLTVPQTTAGEAFSVSTPSVTGFTVNLSPALNGLTTGNFTLLNSAGYPISVNSATTYNGGATYTVGASLSAGQTYTLTLAASGYTFGSAQSLTVPSTTTSETLTVSNPSTTGFTVNLSPALNGLTTSNFTLLNSAGYPISVNSVYTYNGGATYTVGASLSAGQTYTLTAAASGYTFGSTQSLTVPSATTSETLTVSNPSTTGFTVNLSPALNGLTAGNFSLLNSAGNPVAITSALTSNGGATYTLSAALSAGQTYILSASAAGYTFGISQSLTVPLAAVNETLTVSNPSYSGLTVTLSPALNGLTANNFILLNSAGNPVAITSATTPDGGTTYTLSAALSAGQTYTLTATDTGYAFGAVQTVVIPS